MPEPPHTRILLKLSGEALAGAGGAGIDPETLSHTAAEIAEAHRAGVQLGLVVGGGNLFRGIAGAARGMDRIRADHMGMLATCINALALQDALIQAGVPTRVHAALPIGGFAQVYTRDGAVADLEAGRAVIFAGGTGNPVFSTDTAASLRAIEIGAEAYFKATKVDGVYDKDPAVHPDAVRFDRLSYDEVVQRQLRVMDLTAVTLCRDHDLRVRVFRLGGESTIMGVLRDPGRGTTIGGKQR